MSLIPLPAGLRVNGFSLTNPAVTRAHASPFGGTGAESVVDLLQDRWRASFSTTPTTRAEAAAIEAWLNALRGGANTTPLHHFGQPNARGTIGNPHAAWLAGDAAQGADSLLLATALGATLRAGDMLRVGGDANGTGGLLLQCAADCAASSTGEGYVTVPLANRMRRAVTGFRRASAATYIDAVGVLQTAPANVLRYQGGAPLVEAAATNHVLQSRTVGGTSWSVVSVSSASGPASIDGAASRTLTVTNSSNPVAYQVVALASGPWVLSVVAKAGASSTLVLRVDSPAITTATFNLSTGTVTAGAGVISSLGSGWFLCSLAVNAAVINAVLSLGETVGNSVHVDMAQIEAGTAPSSRIPTTTSPATRAADVLPAVTTARPARPFRLASQPAVRHVPGYAEGLALDFVEDLSA